MRSSASARVTSSGGGERRAPWPLTVAAIGALLFLHVDLGARRLLLHLGAHGIHVGADHHRQCVRAQLLPGGEHVPQHRSPGDLVQHLGQRRLHARALSGSEDDNEQRGAAHQALGVVDDGRVR